MANKILFLLTILLTGCFFSKGQNNVGIGTNTPNESAALDINSTTQGLLMPRMTTAQRLAIASPAKGLMVFDNTTNSCWNYDGSSWVNISNTSNNAWTLTGNSGTNPATHFIGTTDFVDVVFRHSNT